MGLNRERKMLCYVFLWEESEEMAQSCVCRTHGCQVGWSMRCSLSSDRQEEGVRVHLLTGTRPTVPSSSPCGAASDSRSR